MILIRRLAAPPGLLAGQIEWTERWKTGQPADWATPAAKQLLRQHLPALTHNKCSYCESTLGSAARLEIEHYHAKTVAPHLAFEWTNLFPACGICNGSKRNESHGGQLLKPDTDDGEEFLWLKTQTGELEPAGPNHAARALATIKTCNLNRGPLCKERKRLYQRTTRLLQDHHLTEGLKREFDSLLHPSTEHKLAVRWALPNDLAQEDRRMYHAAD